MILHHDKHNLTTNCPQPFNPPLRDFQLSSPSAVHRNAGMQLRSVPSFSHFSRLNFYISRAAQGACAAHKINVAPVTFLRLSVRVRHSLAPLFAHSSLPQLYKKPFLAGLSRSPILMNNAGPNQSAQGFAWASRGVEKRAKRKSGELHPDLFNLVQITAHCIYALTKCATFITDVTLG